MNRIFNIYLSTPYHHARFKNSELSSIEIILGNTPPKVAKIIKEIAIESLTLLRKFFKLHIQKIIKDTMS